MIPTRIALLSAVLAGLALGGCVHGDRPGGDVAIVRDLSKVAGCRFVGTVRPPGVQAGLRRASAYDDYLGELQRRTASLSGTHLYLVNEAAGWGAAEAVGAAYRCTD